MIINTTVHYESGLPVQGSWVAVTLLLVRSQLEYNAIVWDPSIAKCVTMLERIQHVTFTNDSIGIIRSFFFFFF